MMVVNRSKKIKLCKSRILLFELYYFSFKVKNLATDFKMVPSLYNSK